MQRHFLDRESDIFPRSSGSDPINLPGVTKFEFESLLDYFYEGYVVTWCFVHPRFTSLHFRMNKRFKPSLESWKSILSISSRFKMTKLRTRAIDEITAFYPRIDPVDQIVLAVQYDVNRWLSIGYAALVRRETPLECEEARRLGVDTMCLIAKARERYRSESVRREPLEYNMCNVLERSPRPPYPDICEKLPTFETPPLSPEPLLVSSTTVMKDDNDVVNRLVQDIFWPVLAKPLPVPDVPDVRYSSYRRLQLANELRNRICLQSFGHVLNVRRQRQPVKLVTTGWYAEKKTTMRWVIRKLTWGSLLMGTYSGFHRLWDPNQTEIKETWSSSLNKGTTTGWALA